MLFFRSRAEHEIAVVRFARVSAKLGVGHNRLNNFPVEIIARAGSVVGWRSDLACLFPISSYVLLSFRV